MTADLTLESLAEVLTQAARAAKSRESELDRCSAALDRIGVVGEDPCGDRVDPDRRIEALRQYLDREIGPFDAYYPIRRGVPGRIDLRGGSTLDVVEVGEQIRRWVEPYAAPGEPGLSMAFDYEAASLVDLEIRDGKTVGFRLRPERYTLKMSFSSARGLRIRLDLAERSLALLVATAEQTLRTLLERDGVRTVRTDPAKGGSTYGSTSQDITLDQASADAKAAL